MKNIKGWLTAGIYKSPVGYDFYSIEGEVFLVGNTTCAHGKAPSAQCRCGFATLVKREDAAMEVPSEALFEVEHGRETLWTNGVEIRALTQDVKKIHFSPECYECQDETHSLTLVGNSRPGVAGDPKVEPSCARHATKSGLFSVEDLSDELGVPVVWEKKGRMADFLLFQEIEHTLQDADLKIQTEALADSLRDSDRRAYLASRVEFEGPEFVLGLIGALSLLPLEILRLNSTGIRELFARADPSLIRAISLSQSGINGSVDFIVNVIKH